MVKVILVLSLVVLVINKIPDYIPRIPVIPFEFLTWWICFLETFRVRVFLYKFFITVHIKPLYVSRFSCLA